MRAKDRRKQIALYLSTRQSPVAGEELSKLFGVSRQIIVQDIGALRTEGALIDSTHFGYVMRRSPFVEKVFKLRHTREQTQDELTTIVKLGGWVVDVFVWHKVYGKIEAGLNVATAEDVEKFLDGVRSGKSSELMNITGGYHYHTVRAETVEALARIEESLAEKGFLVGGE